MKNKILKIAGILVAVLAIIIWATPYIFKGKITAIIRSQFSKDIRAHVSFSDVNISLFRNFPKISVGLDNVIVSCVGEFQDDTLLRAKQLDIACNMKNLLSGHGIQVNSIAFNEPALHALVHENGHANWNIFRNDKEQYIDSATATFTWVMQRYSIHKGSLDYTNEKKSMHIVAANIEQEGAGNLNTQEYDLKTRTTADEVNLQSGGSIPYTVRGKTNVNVTIHVNAKTHNYDFNTDQVVLNGLKLHTEGFFQWISDSSYNMNIRYKVLSTDFKNLLSILPSIAEKNNTGFEASGGANLNGWIKGKYDATHSPAFHTNLDVINGYLKYPDLPLALEHINFGIGINNPDGLADHLAINISGVHAEAGKDTIDMHLMLKNLNTKPFIDFAFAGKIELANIARCIKIDSSARLTGSLIADIYAKGNIPGREKQKKDKFQSGGDLQLNDFSFVSKENAKTISLEQMLMSFTPEHVLVKELSGSYGAAHLSATGSLNNLYDYALKNIPLSAAWDLKTDELNLRDLPMAVPPNMNFAVNAQVEKLHFDNLDLQQITCQMLISEQAVHFLYVKANGLDGDIMLNGTYSTLESNNHPDIAFTYDVKGVDIQKAFLAFNSIRRIMPVAKFMSGNTDAHMTLSGKMNPDMTTDLATLQGEGTILLLHGVIKDFGPLDKLAQSLDVARLENLPLENVKADFSYKNGSVTVPPFTVLAKDMEFDIEGIHGFDQSIDYDVSLKIPRSDLGKKGNRFVKNVVLQAAEKGIPVKIRDAVRMDVKMTGSINSPEVKTDMDALVSHSETDLKKEVDEFVNAKLDSAKQQVKSHPVKKSTVVQTSYHSKKATKTKKTTHKKTTHTKAKKKKSGRNYTTESKKTRSTASR